MASQMSPCALNTQPVTKVTIMKIATKFVFGHEGRITEVGPRHCKITTSFDGFQIASLFADQTKEGEKIIF